MEMTPRFVLRVFLVRARFFRTKDGRSAAPNERSREAASAEHMEVELMPKLHTPLPTSSGCTIDEIHDD
jgi:hypothetical protein